MDTEVKAIPHIEMISVDSSQIAKIGHDPESKTLAIEFTSKTDAPGNLYHYNNATVKDFEDLRDAESVGSHFYKHIKPHSDKFPYRKIR